MRLKTKHIQRESRARLLKINHREKKEEKTRKKLQTHTQTHRIVELGKILISLFGSELVPRWSGSADLNSLSLAELRDSNLRRERRRVDSGRLFGRRTVRLRLPGVALGPKLACVRASKPHRFDVSVVSPRVRAGSSAISHYPRAVQVFGRSHRFVCRCAGFSRV